MTGACSASQQASSTCYIFRPIVINCKGLYTTEVVPDGLGILQLFANGRLVSATAWQMTDNPTGRAPQTCTN